MRIFHVAETTPNETELPGSRLWHVNLYLSLQDLGHELVTLPPDTPGLDWLGRAYCLDSTLPAHRAEVTRRRDKFSEQLVRHVKAAHRDKPIDLLFTYFTSAHVRPEAIRDIRALGIPAVNWYCNASYQFHLVRDIAPAYDYCLVPEKFRLEDYRRAGARPIYCQEAANPNIYRPYDLAREYDVTFVGQKYGNRPGLVARLVEAGVPTRVWGPNWLPRHDRRPLWRRAAGAARQRLSRLLEGGAVGAAPPPPPEPQIPLELRGPPLSDEALIQMYSRSKLSLGFTTVYGPAEDGSPIKQVRLRDFEATMSGACYLVEYFEELTEFFEPDREILCFSSAEELIDKARYYLAHEAERERVRESGLRRARSEHTWQQRFSKAFEQMGFGR